MSLTGTVREIDDIKPGNVYVCTIHFGYCTEWKTDNFTGRTTAVDAISAAPSDKVLCYTGNIKDAGNTFYFFEFLYDSKVVWVSEAYLYSTEFFVEVA